MAKRILHAAVLLLLVESAAFAKKPMGFRMHTINADSTYSACAAIDVNRDGKLDIVCGGFWYEAPAWKKHFIREVQQIRGRFDDYSHLPMDVNSDGWMDYVSANYRSQSIYWVENPGEAGGKWAKHVVDEPGPMETAILADIDDDGQLDLLPNGTKFAAWWEIVGEGDGDDKKHEWVRHDLPIEIAGHGAGFGDVNGDGRGDLVSPHGWLEAPEDRRTGRWVMHHEFSLDRDCSVPMLVVDVDRDGDNDVVWGRGHNVGLYWLEQGETDVGRAWTRHAIDTSWSQAHAIRWADMDGDGQGELVAGKRYMAHDGKDPGAYDPLVAYWYDFETRTRTWHRKTISPGGPAGFGLDPKVADIDRDGDMDVVASGRSGLYWFENLIINRGGLNPTSIAATSPKYNDHQHVMAYKDTDGKEHAVETPFNLGLRRSHILVGMQEAMGGLPDTFRRVPLDVEIIDETETDKYIRQRLSFASEPDDRVPAYLLRPKGLQGKAPAMLCLHQTTKIGKGEPAGLGGRPTLHYAHELAERGFVCLVPDYPSFGDYPYDFKGKGKHHASGTMKAIWNNVRGIDLLVSLPQVHSDRIGCIGHSLGGHNSLYTAAFDQRLRAVVTSCGFDPFHHYMGGKLAGWTSDRYMPRIRDLYNNDPDKMPFDFYEVLAAICPRAIFINAPLHDSNFKVAGVREAVAEVGKAYELRQTRDNLVTRYPDSGHDFPENIRQEAYEWLEKVLR
ncbi:MAG: hypothetical protein CMJ64_18920 [Planctomycetaceae bacterium]|nr:hypothetical protein [Planctomycetaceae bacterium]